MVKNITTFFIAVLLGCLPYTLFAVKNQQELFLQAGKLYQKKAWQDAYNQYDSLENKGAAVWYNMGNCAYRLGNKARAILYWERAQSGASSALQHDCVSNCDAVCSELAITSSYSWVDYISGFYRAVFSLFPTLFLQLLFLLFWFVFLYILFFNTYGFDVTGLGFRLMISRIKILYMLGVLLIFFAPIIIIRYNQYRGNRAVVMTKDARLFVGPHAQYDVLDTMQYAHIITMSDQRPGWFKVHYNNKTGWVPASSIEKV